MARWSGRTKGALTHRIATGVARSDVGGEVDQLIEYDFRFGQHPLDVLGRLGDGAQRGVDRQFAGGRRLVITADTRKRLQRSGTGLGVVAFGIAGLANLSW